MKTIHAISLIVLTGVITALEPLVRSGDVGIGLFLSCLTIPVASFAIGSRLSTSRTARVGWSTCLAAIVGGSIALMSYLLFRQFAVEAQHAGTIKAFSIVLVLVQIVATFLAAAGAPINPRTSNCPNTLKKTSDIP